MPQIYMHLLQEDIFSYCHIAMLPFCHSHTFKYCLIEIFCHTAILTCFHSVIFPYCHTLYNSHIQSVTFRFQKNSDFWIVSDSASEKIGIGFGIVKIWYQKSTGLGVGKILYLKKFRIRFRSYFRYRHTLTHIAITVDQLDHSWFCNYMWLAKNIITQKCDIQNC